MRPHRDVTTSEAGTRPRWKGRQTGILALISVAILLLGGGVATALASATPRTHRHRKSPRHHRDRRRAPRATQSATVGVTGSDALQKAFNHQSATVVTAAPVKVAGDYYFTGQVTVAMGDADQFECQIGNAGTHIFLGSPAATGVFTSSATSTTVYQTLSLTAWGHFSVGQSAGIACGDSKAGVGTVFAGAQLNGILITSSRSQVFVNPASRRDPDAIGSSGPYATTAPPTLPRLSAVRGA